ncbi:MAG: autotransporter-associated beta strand repeat-containing protein [Phycisphaerae bacterium]
MALVRRFSPFVVAAVISAAAGTSPALAVVIGSWEQSSEGWFDWAAGGTTLPSNYSFSTVGATLGTSSLAFNPTSPPAGWSYGTGYYQALAVSLGDQTDGNGVNEITDFLNNTKFSVDVAYDASQWTGATYATLNLIVNAPGWGFTQLPQSTITDSGNSGYPGGWDPTNYPGVTQRTISWDYSSVLSALAGTPGYVQLILLSSTDGTAGVEYFDNAQLTGGATGPANLTWNNNGATGDGVTWDTAVNQNWNNGSSPAQFHAGDTITFNDTNNGHYSITITGSNAPAAVTVNNSQGNYVFSGTGAISGATTLTKSGSSSLTIGNANTYTGGTIVSGGTVIVADSAALGSGSLTIHNGGTVQLQAGLPTAVLLPAVQFDGSAGAWQGTLDLTSDKLVVQDSATHAATLAALQNQVVFGRTNTTGILSTALPAHSAIAVIDNGALPQPLTMFGGVGVDGNSILLTVALLGDANVDGKVDLTDLSTVLNNFGTTTPNWTSGNFDGAATIDLTDLSDVLNNFGLTSPSPTAASFASAATAAPEPASLAALMLATPILLKRRNRLTKIR